MAASSSQPTIRHAEARDAEAIARVHIRTWQHAYRGQVPDDVLDGLDRDLGRRTALWRTHAEQANVRGRGILVADQENSITGFVSYGPAEGEAGPGEVYAIYLDPAFWDRGYGRALFAAAVEGLRDLGFSEAVLWVLGSNERARRFYEAAGWKADGGTKRDDRGTFVLDEVRYRGRL